MSKNGNKEDVKKLKNHIGQIEASLDTAEEFLDEEKFQDCCDAAYTFITYLRLGIYKSSKFKPVLTPLEKDEEHEHDY